MQFPGRGRDRSGLERRQLPVARTPPTRRNWNSGLQQRFEAALREVMIIGQRFLDAPPFHDHE